MEYKQKKMEATNKRIEQAFLSICCISTNKYTENKQLFQNEEEEKIVLKLL